MILYYTRFLFLFFKQLENKLTCLEYWLQKQTWTRAKISLVHYFLQLVKAVRAFVYIHWSCKALQRSLFAMLCSVMIVAIHRGLDSPKPAFLRRELVLRSEAVARNIYEY